MKLDAKNNPVWTKEIEKRGAIFTHPGNCYRSGISSNAALKRYLWSQTLPKSKDPRGPRFHGGFGVYDAPEPWGPWATVCFTEEWDVGPGETSSFPPKWMSADGRSLHLVFSGHDCFSVRQATLMLSTETLMRGASYFPPPESQGGWRELDQPEEIRRLAGMDPDKLAEMGCETVTGKPYDQFAIEALFKPFGIEKWWFEIFEGGDRYGRHPSHALGLPARDMARIAYCMVRGGRWQARQVIPQWFVAETAVPTHTHTQAARVLIATPKSGRTGGNCRVV